MNLELKAIKHSEFASHETHCFEANLYVDNKPFAVVSNDGHGGADHVYPHPKFKGDMDAFRAISDRIAEYFKSLPKMTSEYFEDGLEQSLEMWCCEQVDEFLLVKDLRRNMSDKKALLLIDGVLRVWHLKGSSKAQAREHRNLLVLKQKATHEKVVCLNDIPLSEAIDLFRQYAQ